MVNKAYTLKAKDTNTNKKTHSKNLSKIFHQNIRGLQSKVDEPLNSSINKNHNYSPNNLSYDYCNTNKFTVLHQNIQGITNKIDEFLISLPPNAPQVICLTEHHLHTEEIGNVNFGQYTLGSAFCRQTFKQGGVCIYIAKNICYNAINLDQFIKEKDLEICALKLCLLTSSFTIICILGHLLEILPIF
jgi:hypothetical protein